MEVQEVMESAADYLVSWKDSNGHRVGVSQQRVEAVSAVIGVKSVSLTADVQSSRPGVWADHHLVRDTDPSHCGTSTVRMRE